MDNAARLAAARVELAEIRLRQHRFCPADFDANDPEMDSTNGASVETLIRAIGEAYPDMDAVDVYCSQWLYGGSIAEAVQYLRVLAAKDAADVATS